MLSTAKDAKMESTAVIVTAMSAEIKATTSIVVACEGCSKI
jgi:hypothetical protein